jgi:hypothetical protein
VHAGLAIGFGAALLRTVLAPDGVVATDFTAFWTGWWLILHGRAPLLYDAAAQRAAQQTVMGGMQFQGGLMAFLNPPHAALAGVPFGWLAEHAGERAAFLAWTAGSAALLFVLDRWLRQEWGAQPAPVRWIMATALLAFYPVFQSLDLGQVSLLLGVAALGLYRAVERSQPRAGAAWLLVLSIKPQLLPVVVVFLVARRCWTLLGYGAAMMLAAATLTTALLGPMIWIQYAAHLGDLERFWGTGTPAYMLNVRGALTRLGGFVEHPAIDAAAFAIWIVATVLVGIVFVRRRIDRSADARPAYAMALAVGLLVSPHLFVQDVLIWAVPLVLYTAALRDAGGRWEGFAMFALCWPAWFAVARVIDLSGGAPGLRIDPQIVVLVVATILIAAGTARGADRVEVQV